MSMTAPAARSFSQKAAIQRECSCARSLAICRSLFHRTRRLINLPGMGSRAWGGLRDTTNGSSSPAAKSEVMSRSLRAEAKLDAQLSFSKQKFDLQRARKAVGRHLKVADSRMSLRTWWHYWPIQVRVLINCRCWDKAKGLQMYVASEGLTGKRIELDTGYD